ncbi:hypothetical protein ACLOJK_011781 [Asimina triloba]
MTWLNILIPFSEALQCTANRTFVVGGLHIDDRFRSDTTVLSAKPVTIILTMPMKPKIAFQIQNHHISSSLNPKSAYSIGCLNIHHHFLIGFSATVDARDRSPTASCNISSAAAILYSTDQKVGTRASPLHPDASSSVLSKMRQMCLTMQLRESGRERGRKMASASHEGEWWPDVSQNAVTNPCQRRFVEEREKGKSSYLFNVSHVDGVEEELLSKYLFD